MTPQQRADIKRALETDGLKQKDIDYLRSIDNSDDSYTLRGDQIIWLNDIMRRVERIERARKTA